MRYLKKEMMVGKQTEQERRREAMERKRKANGVRIFRETGAGKYHDEDSGKLYSTFEVSALADAGWRVVLVGGERPLA